MSFFNILFATLDYSKIERSSTAVLPHFALTYMLLNYVSLDVLDLGFIKISCHRRRELAWTAIYENLLRMRKRLCRNIFISVI